MNGFRNYKQITKKYMFELLRERYQQNEKTIDRLTNHIVSDEDVKDFVQIVVDSFEKGYMKAVDDYREQLRKLGFNVEIVPEKSIK